MVLYHYTTVDGLIGILTGKELWVFLTCFCENGDLPSQWRGYASNQGYALGFDPNLLEQALDFDDETKVLGVKPVQYGLDDAATYFAEELEQAKRRTAHPGASGAYAAERILVRLAAIKDPSFREEREWRCDGSKLAKTCQ